VGRGMAARRRPQQALCRAPAPACPSSPPRWAPLATDALAIPSACAELLHNLNFPVKNYHSHPAAGAAAPPSVAAGAAVAAAASGASGSGGGNGGGGGHGPAALAAGPWPAASAGAPPQSLTAFIRKPSKPDGACFFRWAGTHWRACHGPVASPPFHGYGCA
jgi:hypothetical protein